MYDSQLSLSSCLFFPVVVQNVNLKNRDSPKIRSLFRSSSVIGIRMHIQGERSKGKFLKAKQGGFAKLFLYNNSYPQGKI
jgi:hypothetical protein